MMNLDDRATMRDPYPHYRAMREADPVRFNTVLDKWQITGHPEVKAFLKHPDLSSESVDAELGRLHPIERGIARLFIRPVLDLSRNLLFIMDAPRHTRIRSLVTGVFTPKQVKNMEPWIDDLARRQLQAALSPGRCDFMEAFAYPFPLSVIARLLGVDALAQPRMRRWANEVSAVFVKTKPSPLEALRGARATRAVRRFMRSEVEQRWGLPPRDDLLGLLIAAREGGDRLSIEEVVDTAILFLFAGHETTTNLLGNALVALEDRRDLRDRMRTDPALTSRVVEEVLRFDPSVQNLERVVIRDFDHRGHHFRRGEQVVLSIAGANRDPRVYERPDVFDPTRAGRHLSFGHGIHFCIGAALTRMEVGVALQAFVQQVDDYTLGARRYRHSQAHRGMESLEITVG